MNTVLTVDSVVKQFAGIAAVSRLSFQIKKGEIFALLGPNGAGKTTTVRMLMNIIRPDEGTINFNFTGGPAYSSRFGYLPEERGLYQEIPIIRTLQFMGVIKGMEKHSARMAAEQWLERLELSGRKNDKLNTLSKGNQQKIQFIAAVLHSPEFAVLDEPFSGFDPINQENFLGIIKELRDNGTTILLSAHQMHLVEKIADRVLLMNNGKKLTSGTVEEIKNSSAAAEKLIITFSSPPDINFFKDDYAVQSIESCGENGVLIGVKRNIPLSGLLKKAAGRYDIISVKSEQILLHDIFIQKIKEDGGTYGNE